MRVDAKCLEGCPSESVDYAVMENISDALIVTLDIDWSDIGTWNALWEISSKDENGNVLEGDVITMGCSNSYAKSEARLVTAIGLESVIIVETKDSVLVADRTRSEEVKALTELLKKSEREEWITNKKVFRPWGAYETVDEGWLQSEANFGDATRKAYSKNTIFDQNTGLL